MTQSSTAPAGRVDLPGSTSAYFLWEVPEKRVSVRFSLDLVERLERDVLENFRAITQRGSEIGGVLLGAFEPGSGAHTVIDDYELLACDYSRGPLYLLSEEEKAGLADAVRRRRTGLSVAGFFRSNTRKDLSLDEDDLALFKQYFASPENVYLLIKPFATRASVAAPFFWEDGQVRAEASCWTFPFRRSELQKGEFAKSIVTGAGPAEAPAESSAPAPAPHKPASRVLPFVVKHDEEAAPPVPRNVPEAPAPPMERKSPLEPGAPPILRKLTELAPPPGVSRREDRPAVPPAAKTEPVPKTEPAGKAEPAIKTEPPVKAQPAIKTEPPVKAQPAIKTEPPVKTQPAIKTEPPAKAQPAIKTEPSVKAQPAIKTEPPVKAQPTLHREDAPAPGAAPAPVEVPPPAVFAGRKLWALFGGLAMLASAGGTFIYLKSKPVSSAGIAASDRSALQLKVEQSGGQLLVSWNREADLVRSAQKAVLSITDGPQKEDVPLNLAQLRGGSISYKPVTSDVTFRLEVIDPRNGKSRNEYVRALYPLGNAPDALPKPLPPAAEAGAQPQNPADAQPTQADATRPAPGEPPRPAAKPFALASRIRPAEPQAALPEPPRVEDTAGAASARPIVAGPALAPPPPAPAPAPPVSKPPVQNPPAQAPAAAAPSTPPAARVGGQVVEAKLLRKVEPIYPPMARQARVNGTVRVRASIGKDGRIKKVEVLNGHPLLRQAAIDAVQKWVYNPSLLNGEPIDSTTEVDLNFNLGTYR